APLSAWIHTLSLHAALPIHATRHFALTRDVLCRPSRSKRSALWRLGHTLSTAMQEFQHVKSRIPARVVSKAAQALYRGEMQDRKKPGSAKDSHYARLRRAHRDGKNAGQPATRPKPRIPPGENPAPGVVRLYGLHAVRAALDNPARRIRSMLITRNAAERLGIGDLSALPFKA